MSHRSSCCQQSPGLARQAGAPRLGDSGPCPHSGNLPVGTACLWSGLSSRGQHSLRSRLHSSLPHPPTPPTPTPLCCRPSSRRCRPPPGPLGPPNHTKPSSLTKPSCLYSQSVLLHLLFALPVNPILQVGNSYTSCKTQTSPALSKRPHKVSTPWPYHFPLDHSGKIPQPLNTSYNQRESFPKLPIPHPPPHSNSVGSRLHPGSDSGMPIASLSLGTNQYTLQLLIPLHVQ